jgi:thioredoxin reductase
MPDLHDDTIVDRAFLSQEILPFIAEKLGDDRILTAPLPRITRVPLELWLGHPERQGLSPGDEPENTQAVQIPRVHGIPGVEPGIYFSPSGWNIYTLVHELVHWAEFDVLGRKSLSYLDGPCHELLAYEAELAFYHKYPHYKPGESVILDISDPVEALVERVNYERQKCVVGQAISGRFKHDTLIVGAGPAGLSCAINAASEGAKVAIVEAGLLGGGSVESFAVENYAGFPAGLTGKALAASMVQQAVRFDTSLAVASRLTVVRRVKSGFAGVTTDGTVLRAKTLVLAVGVQYRRLSGFDTWAGQGLSYGMAHPCGERVAVVGGANSAGQAALGLAAQGKAVTLLSRSPLAARMSEYLCQRIHESRIAVREGCEIAGMEGHPLHSVTTTDGDTLPIDNVLLYIGAVPHTAWLSGSIARDKHGFILAPAYQTTIPGAFAIGDVRADSVKRIAAAVGEGASVVPAIHSHIRSL